jgi:hypothetical protein
MALVIGPVGEVQAATSISTCGTTIKTSGSYVVTKNLTVRGKVPTCISVVVDFVSIDLGGFAIDCTGAATTGITIGSATPSDGVVVRNAAIANCAVGISTNASTGTLLDRIVTTSSTQDSGIFLNQGSLILDSISNDNQDRGVVAFCPVNAIDSTLAGDPGGGLYPIGNGCSSFNNLAP